MGDELRLGRQLIEQIGGITRRTVEHVIDKRPVVLGRDTSGVTPHSQLPSGVGNAYSHLTDGTTTTDASGGDTIKLRSGNAALTVVVTSNDATHGDNALLTVQLASSTPLANTATGAVGTSAVVARADHAHPHHRRTIADGETLTLSGDSGHLTLVDYCDIDGTGAIDIDGVGALEVIG